MQLSTLGEKYFLCLNAFSTLFLHCKGFGFTSSSYFQNFLNVLSPDQFVISTL